MLDGAQANLALSSMVENSRGETYPPDKLTFKWDCESENDINATIKNADKLKSKATFTRNGVYTLTLTATNKDNEDIAASDSVDITVNQPPIVDAGLDQNLLMSVGDTSITTQLDGTVSDDGLPDPPNILKLKWSVEEGHEAAVTIVADDKDFTDVQFTQEGGYTLKLEADDSAVKVADTVKIIVKNTGMLPGGGRQAKVLANHLNVRQAHYPDNAHNILYTLNMGNEVTVIDLWTNPETNAVWGRLKPTEDHDQDPQWSAMKVGKDTFLEFIE
jgi:hypothetical protein